LSTALALPLLDLSAVDAQRLPRGVIDPKLAAQYQVVVLGKRANRIFVAGADPTDQEAVERIKFATQLSPEWVIVEHDKLAKVLARLDIAEKRVPQGGRMKLKFGAKAIDFRVSTLPTLFGEKIVIRILDPSSAKVGIEALGYEKIEKDRLLKIIQRPYGMVLV